MATLVPKPGSAVVSQKRDFLRYLKKPVVTGSAKFNSHDMCQWLRVLSWCKVREGYQSYIAYHFRSVGASPDSDSDSMGESESESGLGLYPCGLGLGLGLHLCGLGLKHCGLGLWSYGLGLGLGLHSAGLGLNSESRWVRWEKYKANLNFHVQEMDEIRELSKFPGFIFKPNRLVKMTKLFSDLE